MKKQFGRRWPIRPERGRGGKVYYRASKEFADEWSKKRYDSTSLCTAAIVGVTTSIK